jgi:hypothetical protein
MVYIRPNFALLTLIVEPTAELCCSTLIFLQYRRNQIKLEEAIFQLGRTIYCIRYREVILKPQHKALRIDYFDFNYFLMSTSTESLIPLHDRDLTLKHHQIVTSNFQVTRSHMASTNFLHREFAHTDTIHI